MASVWDRLLKQHPFGPVPAKDNSPPKEYEDETESFSISAFDLHHIRHRATVMKTVLDDLKQEGFDRPIDVTSIMATLGCLAGTEQQLAEPSGFSTGSDFEEEYRDHPHIVAHRGGSFVGPENTSGGLRDGIFAGARGVEFDIQTTSDGRVVLLHDDTLERTAIPYEDAKADLPDSIDEAEYQRILTTDVNELPFDIVSTIDLSEPIQYWPQPEHVMPVEHAILLIQAVMGAFGFCEIKKHGDFLTIELMAMICTEYKSNPSELKIISFDLANLIRVKQLMPRFKCYHVLCAYTEADAMRAVEIAFDSGMDGVDISGIPDVVTEDLVKYVHSRGKRIATWLSKNLCKRVGTELDTVANMKLMSARKVDYYTTDLTREMFHHVQAHPHPHVNQFEDMFETWKRPKQKHLHFLVDPDDPRALRGAVHALCPAALEPQFYTEEYSPMHVEVVSGGITNKLRRVARKGRDGVNLDGGVLVRIFGAEGLIDRDVECQTFESVSEFLGRPMYWGRFRNGRVEEWLQGYRSLKAVELGTKRNSAFIAKAVAKLHQYEVPDHLQEYHPRKSALWDTLNKWIDTVDKPDTLKIIAAHDHQPDQCTKEMLNDPNINMDNIRAAIKTLRSRVNDDDCELAFCHNDLLGGNLMLDGVNLDKVVLIDLEYGGIIYVHFDVANHFNEWAGGTDDNDPPGVLPGYPDFSRCPSAAQTENFCRNYLFYRSERRAFPTTDVLNAFMKPLPTFQALSHIYWGLWGISQAKQEGFSKFPYFRYAIERLTEGLRIAKAPPFESSVTVAPPKPRYVKTE